jgi:ectoine hydroxylase-related dioxygenase (phytanoyl-CoA dioxygenase family)
VEGACLRDQCWVRCQHPPGTRPPGQFPHSWHQDGALGSSFGEAPLRGLHTLWLPLVDCGDDAPSLEWLEVPPQRLLQPPELTDDALARRFGRAPRRHARLDAGDALGFGGELIHRTHVTAAMTRRRVSVECRFVAP